MEIRRETAIRMRVALSSEGVYESFFESETDRKNYFEISFDFTLNLLKSPSSSVSRILFAKQKRSFQKLVYKPKNDSYKEGGFRTQASSQSSHTVWTVGEASLLERRIEMNEIDDLAIRVGEELANVVPGSKLEKVLARWSDDRPTIKVGDKYLIQGFIDIFRSAHEIACAVDDTIDPRLPAHCFDPDDIGRIFNIPPEELAPGFHTLSPKDSHESFELQRVAEAIERIAEHIAPEPSPTVGTDYVAERLGCTQTWITHQIRQGDIPKHCCVEGTGNGKPWKFHRRKIDQWIKSR